MKTSRLLITSLLAAAAMGADAFAETTSGTLLPEFSQASDIVRIATGTPTGFDTNIGNGNISSSTVSTDLSSSTALAAPGWHWANAQLKDENATDLSGVGEGTFTFLGRFAYGGEFVAATVDLSTLLGGDKKMTDISISFTGKVQTSAYFSVWSWDGTTATQLAKQQITTTTYSSTTENASVSFSASDLTLTGSEKLFVVWSDNTKGLSNTISNLTSSYTASTYSTLYWRGGDATWSTASTTWSADSAALSGDVAATSVDDVVFDSDASVAVDSGGVRVDHFSVTGGTVSFSGGAITATGGVSVSNGATLALGSALTTSQISLDNGVLESTATLTLASSVSVATSGEINTSSGTLTLSGAISASGATLTKSGTGTLKLTGGASGEKLSIDSGMLQAIGSASVTNPLAFNDIVIKTGATLYLDSENIGGDNSLTWSRLTFEGGTFHVYDTQANTNFLTVTNVVMNGAGTITSTWGNTNATLENLSGTGNLTITNTTETKSEPLAWTISQIASDYSGTISLVKNNKALAVSIGSSSAEGANFDVGSNAALKFTGTGAYSLGTLTMGSGATLSIASSDVTLKGLSGTGAISLATGTAASTLTVNQATTTEFAGTLGAASASISLAKSGEGTLTLSGTNNLRDVSVSGGSLALSGTSTISGTTTVSDGALTLGGTVSVTQSKDSSAFAVSGGTLSFAEGVALSLKLTGDDMLGETVKLVDISGSGSVAELSLDRSNFTYNGLALSERITDVSFNNSTGVITFTGRSLSLTWVGDSSGAGAWDKTTENFTSGSGATTFVNGDYVTFATSGAEVSFGTAISAGKITISEDTTFKLSSTSTKLLSATGIEVASGKNLQLEGAVLGSITGGINLVASDSVVTLKDSAPPNGNRFYGVGKVVLNQTNTSSAFGIAASVFTGDISLEKIGAGTVNLSVAQTYNGDTTVLEGALNATAALTTAGRLTIARDASMTLSAAGTFATISVDGMLSTTAAVSATQLSGEGAIDLGSAGSLTLSNSTKFDAWTGTVKLSDRTAHIALNNYGTSGSTIELAGFQSYFDEGADGTVAANIVLKATGTNDFGAKIKNGWNNKTITFSGSISGDGKFMYTGEDVGSTVVQTFLFTGDVSAFSGGFVQTPATNNKATSILQFGNGGASAAAADASVSGTGEISWNGKNVVYNYSSDVLASNKITSAILVKQGTGSLTLTGDNTYTGGTTVSAGRLIAGSNTALGTTGATTVAAGAELGIASGVTITDAGEIQLAQGARLVIDLSGKATATETFTLDLVSGTALKYNGAAFDEDCTSLITDGIVVLENMTLDGWTQSLSYSGNTLSLTMTIPEPSVFGLLAGLGALALAGSRRRRKA